MAVLELVATAQGGPVTNPEPEVPGLVPFASVQLAERRQNRWVRSPIAFSGGFAGGFWTSMFDAAKTVRDAMDKVDAGVPGTSIVTLRQHLNGLYRSFVAEELRDTLAAVAASTKPGEPPPILRLHLNSELDVIPWELLADGDQFLGLSFQVTRMPIVPGGPRPTPKRARDVKKIVSILGADLADAALRPAWEATFNGAAGNGVDLMRSPMAADDWPTIATLDGARADILHVTCHGMVSNSGQRYWSLDRRRPEDGDVTIIPRLGDQTLHLAATNPLVFANACTSPAAVPKDLAALTDGFGITFYDYGASVFVGTIGPVSKRIAIEFASRFFHHLFTADATAGEALWRTKRSFADEGEQDPSWLFYSMYGDPEARFTTANGHGG